MNYRITFLNDHWFWPIAVTAAILFGVFIWKELARSGRRRTILKLLLSFLAIGALALIALKPAQPESAKAGNIVLLTPGYEKQQLDSLKRKYSGIKVLDYSPQQKIPAVVNEAEVVFILGNGLPEYDLQKMENIPAVYIPGSSPEGVVKVRFPEKISVGEDLILSGLYRKPPFGHRLLLEEPGGTAIDSVSLNNEEEHIFKLSAQLKAPGNFVYFLTEKNPDGKVLTRDPVPVQVEEKINLKILILNNFPTFETKYLKNFLAEAGHELVVRSQITRGRYKYEYFNTNRTVIGSLSRENLKEYDLLIIDAASLRGLSTSQSDEIQNSVREDGLGIFIQPDEGFFNAPGTIANFSFQRQRNTEIQLEEWPEVTIPVFPFDFIPSPGQENVTAGNSVIAAYRRTGQGRIGTTVIANTWQLVLEGNITVYRQIWSQVIGQLSKKEEVAAQLKSVTQLVYLHEPYHFKIRSEMPEPIITNSEGRIIPLVQDLNFPEQWKGIIWPKQSGWNNLHLDTTAVFNFYVSEDGSWSSLNAQNTLEKNQRYFNRHTGREKKLFPFEPINPLWFFVLFIICIGGLWLEPKLS